jgi:thermitase
MSRRLLLACILLAGVAAAGVSPDARPAEAGPSITPGEAVVAGAAVPRRPIRRTRSQGPKRRARAVPAEVRPDDPLARDAWSHARARLPGAWRWTTGNGAVVVAVLDTGVDGGHPDLLGALVAGRDTVNDDDEPTDDHGHGTMVAGIVAARSDNAVGVASACWRCSVMPVKVIGADGRGSAADIAEGIVWAVEHGARILNLSFVLDGHDVTVAAALEHARARGVLVLAAAGNDGGGVPRFPGAAPGVLAVAGSDPVDARYSWSAHGPQVDVAAPGCTPTTALGGGYGELCGTSAATAFASGVAGLVQSAAPSLAAEDVGRALAASAVRVDYVAAGRVDAAAAVETARGSRPSR